MRFNRASHIAAILLVAALNTSTAGAWLHRRQSQKTRVRFLATGTLVRGTWGENEDTYLAQLLLPKQNEAVLVRLVDAYPNEWPPLAREVLTSDSGAVLAVRRDADCDRPFGEMLLRTAPGDPMAILPERLVYQPQMDRVPEAHTILPCYRTVRR
ncbi:MAG: hypothetical protein ACRD3N_17295 [Terracidiphilus sp.]